jgi:transcription elongation factor Elf1
LPNQQKQQDSVLPDETKDALLDILKHCESEDQEVHYLLARKCRRLELYWNNLVDIFWDANAREWRVPDWNNLEDDSELPARVINIYRAHGEIIVAALSSVLPKLGFWPDDADNPDDIDTADSYHNIYKIIQRDNNAQMMFIRALCVLFNQGTVFGYNYYKRDKKFGYYHKTVTEVQQTQLYEHICPKCGYDFGASNPQLNQQNSPQTVKCPYCGTNVQTEISPYQGAVPVEVLRGYEKGRSLIDIYGPLNVKVPYYAKDQAHMGYLLLKFDESIALLSSIFCNPGPNGEPPALDYIQPKASDTSYDYWVRYPSIYLGSQPQNTAIVKCLWLRPFQYECLRTQTDDRTQDIADLSQRFPNGCYVIYINDKVAEAYEEDLDEHWTVTIDPRAQTIHGEPIGTNLATIQDIRAEISELELQTMEHGISEVFFNKDLLDTDEYRKQQAKPGSMTPVVMEEGKRISDMMFETRTTNANNEAGMLKRNYDQDAQFIIGSLPNIYGGDQPGDQTLGEFTKNRAQALQRLGTIWRIVSGFYADMMYKAVKDYASYLDYDENIVEKTGGSFQNSSVRQDSLYGSVSRCTPENVDDLPLTWNQVRDIFAGLMNMAKDNPIVSAVLAHPENNEIVRKATGLHELYIPGEDDRNKQYREIQELLQQQPSFDPNIGYKSTITPEPQDDHPVHADICKRFLNSATGYRMKTSNSSGYLNVLAHYQEHMQEEMQQQQTMPNKPVTAHPGVS